MTLKISFRKYAPISYSWWHIVTLCQVFVRLPTVLTWKCLLCRFQSLISI